MSKVLRLSDDLALPVDFATEGVAVIGMRGSGKSNTEARFAELLYDAGVPWVVVDPKGDWHGIRSSADGKQPGLSVPVFGGLHGDFPLDAKTGARIADLLVDENLSAVLDVSHLSKTGELPTFLIPFCNQLMHRHQLEPHVRTAILEEAHRYIPQNVTGKVAELKEAAAAVLLEGRSFGLGCWAATQRPARLHKDVLEEVANAIIHRIGVAATNDKRTIAGWVKHYDLSESIVDSLTDQRDGQAWVLMPQARFVKQVQMQRRTTFDSAATPKVGATIRRPSTMADIDQAAIKEALADVIDRAKADDPKELRRRIAELDKALKAANTAQQPEVQIETVTVEVPVLDEDLVARLEHAMAPVQRALADIGEQLGRAATAATRAAQQPAAPPPRPSPARRPTPAPKAAAAPVEGVSGPQQRILDALAWFAGVGIDPVDRTQLALMAEASPRSSAYGNNLGALRTLGLIDYPGRGVVALTAAGTAIAQPGDDIRTSADLHASLFARLPKPQVRILEVLVDAYPDDVDRAELADASGASPTSSAYGNNLGALRTLGLIDYPGKGRVAARPVLFLA